MYHVLAFEGQPIPGNPADLFVDHVFAAITGFNLAAADFAAAEMAGTAARGATGWRPLSRRGRGPTSRILC